MSSGIYLTSEDGKSRSKVGIYITSKDGKESITVPVLPEKIIAKYGETKFVEYEIMGAGTVAIPTGVGLTAVSWQSEFPGEARKGHTYYMATSSWKAPYSYDKLLQKWRANRTPLRLMVTGYPINMDVYLANYTGEASGGFGDWIYEIEFRENKNITIKSTDIEKDASKHLAKIVKRLATKASTYTVKSGDNLWKLSVKFYNTGTKHSVIYKANKVIIEKEAKAHGKKSSNNGWWIYPGTKLVIP